MNKVSDPLWGIDDEKAAKDLRAKASKAAAQNPGFRRINILAALAYSTTTVLLVEFTFIGRLPSWARLTLIGAVIGFLTGFLQRRGEEKELPAILRAEDRCTRCGYKIDSTGIIKCPECGTEINSQLADRQLSYIQFDDDSNAINHEESKMR